MAQNPVFPSRSQVKPVKQVPELSNQAVKSFKEPDKEPHWAKAATLADLDVTECANTWNRMRNSFSKNRKCKATGSKAHDVKCTFVYTSEMEFVLPFVELRAGRSSNMQSYVLFVDEEEQKSARDARFVEEVPPRRGGPIRPQHRCLPSQPADWQFVMRSVR